MSILAVSNKLKWEYLEMCGFVRAHMSLSIVRSNTLFLRGARDKKAYIRPRPNMEDGAVMTLLEPWRVQIPQRLGRQRLGIRAYGGGLNKQRRRKTALIGRGEATYTYSRDKRGFGV